MAADNDWKSFFSALNRAAVFGAPATQEALQQLEAALNIAIPSDLRSLLEQADGVAGEYGLGLVWPCKRIVEDNVRFRTDPDFQDLYMPFEPLLFFADAGNGDQFAYTICGGKVRPDIFVWNHEDDSRCWSAPSLERYLEWWLSGKVKV